MKDRQYNYHKTMIYKTTQKTKDRATRTIQQNQG